MQSKSSLEFVIISDGGSAPDNTAGSACIVQERSSRVRLKVNAYLGHASDHEAELIAGLLGLSVVHKLASDTEQQVLVHWFCDRVSLLDYASSLLQRNLPEASDEKDFVMKRYHGLWSAFLQLTLGWQINFSHIPGHSGHREHEACDRACRWVQKKGLKLLTNQGEGRIGRNKELAPEHAWFLIDGRNYLKELRKETPSTSDILLLKNRLLKLGVFPEQT